MFYFLFFQLFEAIVEENDLSDEQKARISKKLGEADKVIYDSSGINYTHYFPPSYLLFLDMILPHFLGVFNFLELLNFSEVQLPVFSSILTCCFYGIAVSS